nr:MAG TPA: hypothetical protein [Microviridae sp.]
MVVSEKIRTFAIDKGKDPLQVQLNSKDYVYTSLLCKKDRKRGNL